MIEARYVGAMLLGILFAAYIGWLEYKRRQRIRKAWYPFKSVRRGKEKIIK